MPHVIQKICGKVRNKTQILWLLALGFEEKTILHLHALLSWTVVLLIPQLKARCCFFDASELHILAEISLTLWKLVVFVYQSVMEHPLGYS